LSPRDCLGNDAWLSCCKIQREPAKSLKYFANLAAHCGVVASILRHVMNSATKGRLIGLVGLASVALWLTLSLGSDFYLCLTSLRWLTVPVRITSSDVSTGVSNMGRWWLPELTYEYQVGGQTYRSSNIRYLMPPFYHAEGARQIQTAYPKGAQVQAAIDPQKPSRSVLEPGIPEGMWWRGLIPLFFWALTGYIFYEIRNPHRRFLLLRDPETAGQE
jgi:hypothetical protein